ncbi:hypothetical protein BH24CHL7_BH24CHL7_13120 [soil metagenome]
MPRLRTIVGFLGGVLVWIVGGLVPAEVISWLRGWAVDGHTDGEEIPAERPRRRQRRRRRS